jgi:hypothetical protein
MFRLSFERNTCHIQVKSVSAVIMPSVLLFLHAYFALLLNRPDNSYSGERTAT